VGASLYCSSRSPIPVIPRKGKRSPAKRLDQKPTLASNIYPCRPLPAHLPPLLFSTILPHPVIHLSMLKRKINPPAGCRSLRRTPSPTLRRRALRPRPPTQRRSGRALAPPSILPHRPSSDAATAAAAQLGVDIEPARLVIGSAHYGSARYGSLRYRAESLARLGSFKSWSQLVSS
jgi:hypothetical protein